MEVAEGQCLILKPVVAEALTSRLQGPAPLAGGIPSWSYRKRTLKQQEEDPHFRSRPKPAKEPPNGLLILYNISRIICIFTFVYIVVVGYNAYSYLLKCDNTVVF